MSEEILNLDGLGQAECIRKGDISAKELMQATLKRIESTNAKINALASLDANRALELAEKKLRNGPFAGVPFFVKDVIPYPGLGFTMGSRLFAQNVSGESTPYTERIDAAGFITIGKTTTSEFGLLGSTESLLHGVTRNPWNLDYSASGSSGGSAAAVASRMVPLAHASDGGGSIRIPASVNGLFGLKPGAGRTYASSTGQSDFLNLVSDHCLTRSVRDSAAFLDVTEKKGSDASLAPVGFVNRPVDRPLRIGIYRHTLLGAQPEREILDALEKTALLCADLGHEIIEAPLPPLDGKAMSNAFFTVAGSVMDELSRFMEGLIGKSPDESFLEPFTLSLREWFRGLPPDAMEQARRVFLKTGHEMEQFAAGYDLLLSPTLGVLPQRIGHLSPEKDRDELIRLTEAYAGFTPVHNISGMPAMSIPLHIAKSGLPLGSHFAASKGGETTLLGLAYQLEEASPWKDRYPEF